MRNASALSGFVATMIAVGGVLWRLRTGPFHLCPTQVLPMRRLRPYNMTPAAAAARLPARAGRPEGRSGVPVAAGSAAKTRHRVHHRPRRPAGRLDLPQSCQRPQRGHRQGHQPHRRAHRRLTVGTVLRLAQAGSGRRWGTKSSSAAGAEPDTWRRNGKTGNYIDALQRGDWKLPYGTPALVVIEGGGNDAARGATDAQIVANADRLIASIQQRYPAAGWPWSERWPAAPTTAAAAGRRWTHCWGRWPTSTGCRLSASATG